MKSTFLKISWALLLYICAYPVDTLAYSFQVDNLFYNIISSEPKSVEVTYQSIYVATYSGDIIIPGSISYSGVEYEVKGISKKAFYECTELTSVVIPKTVTYIGEDAFRFCKYLSSVKIEEGNPIYDSREDCNAIIETESNTLLYGSCKTVIPNTVTAIGDDAFNRIRLESDRIVIPNSVATIGNRAFMESGRYATLVIPNSIKSIGSMSFTNLLPTTVISYMQAPIALDNDSWYDYDSYDWDALDDWLESSPTLYVPKGTASIYKKTSGWSWFQQIIEIENDSEAPKEGEMFAYYGINYKIISLNPNDIEVTGASPEKSVLNIPETVIFKNATFAVKSISDHAFRNSEIESVSLPNSLTYIGDNAFERSFIQSICIPKSVTHIGERAFLFTLMREIKVEKANAIYDSRADCNAIIETATNTLLFSGINTVIPNSVIIIGNDAFNEGILLSEKLVIPNSVTTIGDRAFMHLEVGEEGMARDFTIPESVTSIGSQAFYGFCDPTIVFDITSEIEKPFEIPLDCFVNPDNQDEMLNLQNNVVLYVPNEKLNAYKNTQGWNIFTQIREIESQNSTSDIFVLQQNSEEENDKIYNLLGQCITKPMKGIHIIKKKKILVK